MWKGIVLDKKTSHHQIHGDDSKVFIFPMNTVFFIQLTSEYILTLFFAKTGSTSAPRFQSGAEFLLANPAFATLGLEPNLTVRRHSEIIQTIAMSLHKIFQFVFKFLLLKYSVSYGFQRMPISYHTMQQIAAIILCGSIIPFNYLNNHQRYSATILVISAYSHFPFLSGLSCYIRLILYSASILFINMLNCVQLTTLIIQK